MKDSFGLLIDSLIFLSSAAVIVAGGVLIYFTIGHRLSWPEPRPEVTYVAPAPNDTTGGEALGENAATGLVLADGFELVRQNCTVCHSAKLITQNRATREGWASMIDWMQEKQGLWELGVNEAPILDYLATHYGVGEQAGRRANLEEVEWYILEL